MEVFADIEQGTPEWFEIRMGRPTASRFADVCRQRGVKGGIPKTRQTYMYQLAGEIITGEPMTTFENWDTRRGREREGEARALYAFMYDVEPQQVGFIRNGIAGCSPDSLVGNDGMFENKDALPHVQIERLLSKKVPSEHVMQLQGNLLIAEREWIDFASHCRNMPLFVKRIYRDETKIQEIRDGLQKFHEELQSLVEKIRGMQ